MSVYLLDDLRIAERAGFSIVLSVANILEIETIIITLENEVKEKDEIIAGLESHIQMLEKKGNTK